MRSEDEAQHQAQLDQDGDDVATAHSRGHPPQEWRHRLKITQSKYLPAAKRQRSFENVSEACPNGGSTTELWRGVKRFGPRPKLSLSSPAAPSSDATLEIPPASHSHF